MTPVQHPFVLLLLVPALALLRRRPLLAATAATIVLALAGPVLPGGRPARRIVLVLDASGSAGASSAELEDWAEAFRNRLEPGDRLAVVRVAAGAAVTRPLAPASEPPPASGGRIVLPAGATDLAAGLDAAREVLAGRPGDVFLVSDGRANRGDARAAAARLAAAGAKLLAVPLGEAPSEDAAVLAVRAPDRARPGVPFEVVATVVDRSGGRVEVALRTGEAELERRSIELAAGVPAHVVFAVAGLAPKSRRAGYAVRISRRSDEVPENDEALLRVLEDGASRPLVVSTRADSAFLRLLAPEEPLAVAPADAPIDPADYAGVPLVVLEEVPADALSDAAQRALEAAVRRGTTGLLAAGVERAFGTGGYPGTVLERILPVWSDPRRRLGRPLALVVCLDRSGSMNEAIGSATKIHLAKAAFTRLVDRLEAGDAVALVPFAEGVADRVPAEGLLEIEGPEGALRLGGALGFVACGGTDLRPALEDALRTLQGTSAPLRHVLVVSDGKPKPGTPLADLGRQLAEAGATLSILLTAEGLDSAEFDDLVRAAGARVVPVLDVDRLPDVFLQEIAWKKDSLVRDEGPYPVRFRAGGEVFPGAVPAGPVPRFVRTTAREQATVHFEVGEGDPLAATWQVHLGKAGALTADADRLAGGEELLGRLVGWLTSRATASGVVLEAERAGDGFEIRVRLEAFRASLADPTLEVGGERVELVRVEPSLYRARWSIPAVLASPFVPVVLAERSVLAEDWLAVGPGPELLELGADRPALEALAAVAGGDILDALDPGRARPVPAGSGPVPLSPFAVALALVLFLAERVRVALH